MQTVDQEAIDTIDFSELVKDLENLSLSNPKSDILAVLKQGLPLDAYKTALDSNMQNLAGSFVESYLHNSDYLLDLYHETRKCDSVLAQMESVLTQFSDNLSGVSDEIRSLQFRSEQLSSRLRVQSESQSKLTDFLNSVIVSPDMVGVIFDEEDCGSEKFIKAVNELSRQITAHATLSQSLPAVAESGPELTRLKNKANGKIREFLVTKINSLKKQGANVQTIQKNVLLKAKKLMRFLKANEPSIFNEIVAHYSSTISKIFTNQFRQYIHSLSKLHMETVASKSDLLGSNLTDPSTSLLSGTAADLLKLRIGATSAPVSSTSADLVQLFCLQPRDKILSQFDAEVLVVSPPTENQPNSSSDARYFPESLLRFHQKLLCDTASGEYLFLLDFFDLHRPQSPSASNENDKIEKYFDQIFAKILIYFTEQIINTNIRDSFDLIGLLLQIRTIEHYQDMMINRRKIAVLDSFFENILAQMRQRLRFVIDLNVDSFKRVDARKLSPDNIDVLVKRVAELLASVQAGISTEQGTNLVSGLMVVFENFLKAAVASKKSSSGNPDAILLKHYSVVMESLSRYSQCSTKEWDDRVNVVVGGIVEKTLTDHFGPMIKVTLDAEKVIASGGTVSTNLSELERCVMSFGANWKIEMDKIKVEIFGNFQDKKIAKDIYNSACTQLLLYYTRFLKIVELRTKETGSGSSVAWVRQIVPSTVVMTEIKQILSNINQ